MNFKNKLAAVLAVMTLHAFIATATANAQERTGANTWIERPWEISYVLFVKAPKFWREAKERAITANADPKETYFWWKEFFEPTHTIPMPDLRAPAFTNYPEDKAVVVITFDNGGFVTSPNSHPGPLRGRLNRLRYITLSAGDDVKDRHYDLGDWFVGLNEDTPTEVTPALCGSGSRDMPDMLSVKSDRYIYGAKYKIEPESYEAFGCREWSYQLQTSTRPYIDVTTYVPKPRKGDKTPYKHGTYIGDVVGWGTFGVKKPVIGKHADTWYCLYDCPGDDKPGKVEDINAWAQRNGWKPPKSPTRMPVFVDDPRKRGTYPE